MNYPATSRILPFVLFFVAFPQLGCSDEVIDASLAKPDVKKGILWYDAKHTSIEGQGWSKTKSIYDRLPAKAEDKVRVAVWNLSRHSAGICANFTTDATTIYARWTLTSNRLAMPHMPATGVSGLDLYVQTDDGKWRWLAVGRPAAQKNTVTLVTGIPPGKRRYILYFPLYNGVSSVEIGVGKKNIFAKPPPRPVARRKPIIFYGTSITQGGCASRPGMVHTAILGRMLNRPVINLGFSGNGRMEKELAQLMAEIDASIYVIDCLPNISAAGVSSRTAPLVHILRKAHPKTPILLVEDRSYTSSFLRTSLKRRNQTSRAALKRVFAKLKNDGVPHLYYLDGEHLLGEDGEDTVDGSHPTDLGFMRQAEAFYHVLQPILDGKASQRK